MKYTKLPITFETQADLLINRGLIVKDKSKLIQILQNVNYYRLTGYLYPYRELPNNNFRKNTTFEIVWKHYTFDRRLCLIILDAIERIEVSFRTQLIYKIAHETKAFGYIDRTNYPNLNDEKFNHLKNAFAEEAKRSRETFVEHFNKKYSDEHRCLPIWMLGEILSFGTLLTMYKGISNKMKQEIASYYGIPDKVMISWLMAIHVIRNTCAHHGRIWNRILVVKPLIPKKERYPNWHNPESIKNNRIFSILTIFVYLLKIVAPNTKWKDRFYELLKQYPEIDLKEMGFYKGWQNNPIWKTNFKEEIYE